MKKIIVLFIILLSSGCKWFKIENNIIEVFNYVEKIEGEVLVNSYTIYGRFLNLEGVINGNYDTLSLVLKDNEIELEYPLILENNNDKTIFKTSKLINNGINLDKILNRNYIIYLKNNDNYYTLKNNTKYKDLKYYTITKNNKNYEININFLSLNNKNYMYLKSNEVKLPNDIYDIVIDPGHGGKDIGASSNGYNESDINLDYSLLLKKELDKLGLKVKLTRESDKSIANYGKNGRVSISYNTKAKLMLSIHMNSAKGVKNGGVEIYVPNYSDYTFARNVAKNIVDNTSSDYSPNTFSKVENGVYLRTLSENDIKQMEEDAKKGGYTINPKVTTNSTYYYIIRETGGIITDSYIDGRDSQKEANPYVNSNHGCESYLLELGYMNSQSNLDILLKEKEKFVEAITLSVKDYLEIE